MATQVKFLQVIFWKNFKVIFTGKNVQSHRTLPNSFIVHFKFNYGTDIYYFPSKVENRNEKRSVLKMADTVTVRHGPLTHSKLLNVSSPEGHQGIHSSSINHF